MESALTAKASVLRSIWRGLAMTLFALFASFAMAQSSGKFTLTKDACLGNLATLADPSSCNPADMVPSGATGYYMITITNPWSQPQQTIDVTDSIPAQFTPTVGAIFCRDENNQPVPWTPSNSSLLMSVPLAVGQTVHCYIGGTFGSGGAAVSAINEATGTNKANFSVSDDAKTAILPSSQLNVNLALTKSASVSSVDLTTGAKTVTYTIKITNQGSIPVTLGQWFVLHDSFSLLPSSVPLNAAMSNFQCVPTPGSTCLDNAGPQIDGQWNDFVGTMGSHHAFDWGFANNGDSIAAGGVLTITFDVVLSPINGIDCVKDKLTTNGITNSAHFTLTDASSGSAKTDLNPADNFAKANVASTVPANEVDQGCGDSQLRVSKQQISPTNPVAWGSQVEYEIRIKNVSVPAQTISIDVGNLQDFVQEGINTPPFFRSHIKTLCDASSSSPSTLCSPFGTSGTGGINIAPDHAYSYYLEMNQGWDTAKKITLDPGEEVVFRSWFVYDKPDCETVPKTPTRPITNHVRVTYKAQPYGSPSGTAAVMQSVAAKAETLMAPQSPCKFKVTKTTTDPDGKLQFNSPIKYTVTFTNLGPGRNVGTVMDAVRISIANYASLLPFSASWNCVGVSNISGSQNSGMATYVPSPAQGAPAALLNLGSNIYFPPGGTLTCTITMVIQRPPLNDTFCTREDAYFENLALMDVTAPFNNSIYWPPSGTYLAPPVLSNPNPQDKNWASVRLMLPKCWDAQVVKTATVDGLPANTAPWTFVNNIGHDVHFHIAVTDLADSKLGSTPPASNTPPNPGWDVTDKFEIGSVYNAMMLAFENCQPSTWCWTTGPGNNGTGKIGIRNLNPLQQGIWNNKLGQASVQVGKDIRNCAWIIPVNTINSADWYNRQYATLPSMNCSQSSTQPLLSCSSGNKGPLFAYACVPVLETTQITVKKVIVDQTGGTPVTTAPGAYGVTVGCTPFAIPTWVASNVNLSAGGPGQTVTVVPMGSTCTVTEVGSPIPPLISVKCGGAGNVIETVSYSPLPSPLAPKANAIQNTVTVTNTYTCKGGPTLVVAKKFLNPEVPNGGGPFPAMQFPVSVSCTPGGTQSQPIGTSGNAWSSISFPVTVGAVCQVVENIASVPFPQNAIDFCANMNPAKVPVWKPPVYAPQNGTPPGTSITIANGTNQVTIKNEWKCDSPPPADGQLEVIKELNTIVYPVLFPATTWAINSNCAPGGTLTITTPPSGNSQIVASYPNPISAPIGTNCSVSEVTPANNLLPPWIQNWCAQPAQGSGVAVWNLPEYSVNNGPYSTTPPSVQMASGITTVRVRNGWHCVPTTAPTATFQYQVFKRVTGPTTQVPAMTFAISANCTPGTASGPVNVITNYPHTSFVGGGAISVPSGSSCNFTEVLPDPSQIPAMAAYCSAQAPNILPKWLPPVWSTSPTGSPAMTLPVTASANLSLFVTNTWICTTPPTGKVKPKGKPKIKLNIGIGSIFGGGGNGEKPRDTPGDTTPPRP